MGNIMGSMICRLLGYHVGGKVGASVGMIGGASFGAFMELGHLVAAFIQSRGQHKVATEAFTYAKWEIVEIGIRYCPLNVAPGPMNFWVDFLRHLFAPLGSWKSGVLRHDWVAAKVKGPNGEFAWLTAKKCCDGSIVLAWCNDISEADIAGMDIVKGCKKSLGTTWLYTSRRTGRKVRDFLQKVLIMSPTYNCIMDNCQDFAREMLQWHERQSSAAKKPLLFAQ